MRRTNLVPGAAVISPPSKATLRKYGLSAGEWLKLAAANDYACPICLRAPPDVTLCVDHEHVKGFRKMPAEEKVKYVRTLACIWCNKVFLPRGITADRAERVAKVLRAYEARRAA
jgi:hypothetical protein